MVVALVIVVVVEVAVVVVVVVAVVLAVVVAFCRSHCCLSCKRKTCWNEGTSIVVCAVVAQGSSHDCFDVQNSNSKLRRLIVGFGKFALSVHPRFELSHWL